MATNTKGIYYSTSADAPITEEARSLATANSVPVGPNYIINGAFDIWQRSTSSTAAGYSTADRWFGNAGGTTTFAQEASNVPTGFRYAYRMTLGTTTSCYVEQAIETNNAVRLAGKTVTLSSYMAGSVTQSVSLQVYYSTSTDVAPGGSWVSAGTTTVSVGTSWSRFSTTVSIPSTAKSLKVSLVQQGSNASGVVLYITGVQLEEGSVVTTFRRNAPSIQSELAACQRYFVLFPAGTVEIFNPYFGVNLSSGNQRIYTQFPVEMRTAPSVLTSGGSALNVFTYYPSNAGSNASISIAMGASDTKTMYGGFNSSQNGSNSLASIYATGVNANPIYVSAEL